MSNLAQRLAFAAVAIPAVATIVWVGGWVLALALAALGVLGAGEVYGLARRQGVEALTGAGYGAAAAVPLGAYWIRLHEDVGVAAGVFAGVAWLLAVPVLAMRRGPGARPLAAVGVTVFGVLYAAVLPAFLLLLRYPAAGPGAATARAALVLFPLALTWLCDTAAMAAGSAIGGRRLAPVLSPGKTWAGAVGGAVAAVALAPVLGLALLRPLGWDLTVPQLLGVGLAVGTVGQLGDVAESLFKREAGVKDSSALLPGHGGILDRLDSLYYVIPVSAILFRLYGAI
jgi:phosphatidate cytidylyltransferase